MSERNDSIRKEILFQLYGTRGIPQTVAGIHKQCRFQRLDYTDLEIHREMEFLHGEGLVEPLESPGTTARMWKITSAGVRHYEQTYAP